MEPQKFVGGTSHLPQHAYFPVCIQPCLMLVCGSDHYSGCFVVVVVPLPGPYSMVTVSLSPTTRPLLRLLWFLLCTRACLCSVHHTNMLSSSSSRFPLFLSSSLPLSLLLLLLLLLPRPPAPEPLPPEIVRNGWSRGALAQGSSSSTTTTTISSGGINCSSSRSSSSGLPSNRPRR